MSQKLSNWRSAYDQFVAWYCSEPRLAFNRIVVVRYRLYLEARHLATNTIHQQPLGATLAGSLGPGFGDLRDAILEVGVASFPLLLIPRNGYERASAPPDSTIARSPVLIAVAFVVFGAFAASLGHGIRLLP